ncbi:MAG: hypothetical protein DRH90_00465 [Deltaproteobacteria bacterium]|nr:MAG: hypothetical protein DRH90_00465 [Deltaproteobacteria bacterium]RLC19373.1 MAG: hypothetical protein DRI24_00550 [Deltaproteobacteria bacterium]HHE75299.1 hypothetical protein [Desulfobacteraceae bacterium]
MTKTIDARGLFCPAPVLMAKEAVEKDHLAVHKPRAEVPI